MSEKFPMICKKYKYIAYDDVHTLNKCACSKVFIAYVIAVIQIKIDQNWTYKKTFLALLAALIPFGTFWADWKLFR